MRSAVLRGVALLLGGMLAACGGESEREARSSSTEAAITADEIAAAAADTAVAAEPLARARSAADGLGRELQAKLFAALDSAGPEGAVAVCADSAQLWSARHASEGTYVRRVSMRVRNPANRPDAVEERELRRLDSLHRAGSLPGEVARVRTTENGDRMIEYLRPIIAQPRCLACHGEREIIAPGVLELLATRYPSDQAVGYRAGDLRGMISVRVQP